MTNDRNTGESQERTDHGNAARSNPTAGQQQSGQGQGMQSDDNDYGQLDGDKRGQGGGQRGQGGRSDQGVQNDADNGVRGYGQEKRQPATGADDFDDQESIEDDENGRSGSGQRSSL